MHNQCRTTLHRRILTKQNSLPDSGETLLLVKQRSVVMIDRVE